MIIKTTLLDYILTKSKEFVVGEDRGITENHFIITLFDLFVRLGDDELPKELKDDKSAIEELVSVKSLFDDYHISFKETGEKIKEKTFSIMDDFANEVAFRQISFKASMIAMRDSSFICDTAFYVEAILSEPTDIIAENVTSLKKTEKEEDNQPFIDTSEYNNMLGELFSKQNCQNSSENDDSDDDEEITEDFLFDLFDEEEKPPKKEEKKHSEFVPVESGIERLAKLVESTRNIQDELREHIIGQDKAISTFISGLFQSQLMSYSRKGTKKPQATFLFAGPPGVGKTALAIKAAEILKMPFKRFDMSEYSDKEANLEFCGSDKVYKNGKPGNVTEFVSKNPKCFLLFDEVEKAHMNIIYLFLQMLDAGRLRDNYTDEEVSFTDAVIIFTTNAGKELYEDASQLNLSALPKKQVLKAISTDINPITNAPLFPPAICSRFASGNVVMFNHLSARELFVIAKEELNRNVKGFQEATEIKVNIDDRIPSALMFAEGGKADARMVKGRANTFFHDEILQLLRSFTSEKRQYDISKLKNINIKLILKDASPQIKKMFVDSQSPKILLFASPDIAEQCKEKLGSEVEVFATDKLSVAKDILFDEDISIVVCDYLCNVREGDFTFIDAEDIESDGHDFLAFMLKQYSMPVYILQREDGQISHEEMLSFASVGVRDVVTLNSEHTSFAGQIVANCDIAYQQSHMFELAKNNKVLAFKEAQTILDDESTAEIYLTKFHLNLVADAEDSKSIVNDMSKPDLKFDDVIGAEDAKKELNYFVEYLKNPVKYMRKGLKAPRGVLLYGPPGTGKTMLAKAMAGESDVTFIKAEGNQFLKKYIGEGSEAVHALFNSARKYAPSIIFVDEIDAIAKSRTSEDNGGGDISSVLTAFLTEMDGFSTDSQKPVFVLAATNFNIDKTSSKSLDPALLRRFDRRIYVDLPSREERKTFIEKRLEKTKIIKISKDAIDNIALRSTGMSLAELDSVFELALRGAIRIESGIVGDEQFEDAFETFNSGEKKEWSKESLKRTARHEAGHAFLCWLSGEKPSYITIVARGDHGGYMQHGDNEDKGTYTRKELLSRIRTALAGRGAEIVYYGDEDGISTGASGDLYSATTLAEEMVCNFGMDEDVGLSYVNMKEADPAYRSEIREKVNKILKSSLAYAVEKIKNNKKAIDKMVEVLLERNHVMANEIDEIFSSMTKER